MLGSMGGLSTELSIWVNRGRNLLFPPDCVFCHVPVHAHGSSCSACATAVHVWPQQHCLLCGRELPQGAAVDICGHCLRHSPPQASSESLYIYQEGPVRSAILDWKLRGRDAGVHWLLDAAAPRLSELFDTQSLLLPVPMPLARMRRAGRHHAADLCRAIARRTGARVDWQLLRRCGTQHRQSSLSGRARWKNLRKAFVIDSDHRAEMQVEALPGPPQSVWVVDDIMTTGATMHYACRSLLRAGIQAQAFSFARLSGRMKANTRS